MSFFFRQAHWLQQIYVCQKSGVTKNPLQTPMCNVQLGKCLIQLMEEILHHLGCKKPCNKHGINYLPQLVSLPIFEPSTVSTVWNIQSFRKGMVPSFRAFIWKSHPLLGRDLGKLLLLLQDGAPSRRLYTWSYKSHKWPCTWWVPGITTLLTGVATPCDNSKTGVYLVALAAELFKTPSEPHGYPWFTQPFPIWRVVSQSWCILQNVLKKVTRKYVEI